MVVRMSRLCTDGEGTAVCSRWVRRGWEASRVSQEAIVSDDPAGQPRRGVTGQPRVSGLDCSLSIWGRSPLGLEFDYGGPGETGEIVLFEAAALASITL